LRVATVTPKEIIDIAEARVALDMEAVKEVLADPSGSRMAVLMQGWKQYERLAFDPDPVVQHDAHLALHRTIWAAADNFLLLKLWPVVEAHLTIVLAQYQMTQPDPSRTYTIHAQLISAIQTHDMDTIRAAFVAHTIDAAHVLADVLTAQSAAQ
jgi:DNA-binding GntR family transcriptional regulator